MSYGKTDRRRSLRYLCIGAALMNAALFLHPMNPADFLALALSRPWDTLQSYGGDPAFVFWAGLLLAVAGMVRAISYGGK